MPYGIPDDPMIREIERTGYPSISYDLGETHHIALFAV